MLIVVCAGAVALGATKLLKRHNKKQEETVPIPEHKEAGMHERIG